jgi:hypothetical protein
MWYQLRTRKLLGVLLVLFATYVFGGAGCDRKTDTATGGIDLDTTSVGLSAADFDSAESCRDCHPQQFAEWSGSMHAYALKDPVFEEVRRIGQSAYPGALEGACVQCHSPIGKRIGELPWGELDLDALSPISREGIGCDLCHTITSISSLSNGGVELTPGNTKYGSIRDPQPTTAHNSENHPLYGTSEYCGACHDFVTDAGLELETTFREWRQSGLAVTGKECNDCHMPPYQGQAAVGGPVRTLHRHTFPGVDLARIEFPNRPEQSPHQ